MGELAAAIAPFATECGRQSAGALTARIGSSPHIVSLPPAATGPSSGSGTFGAASTMNVPSGWQQGTYAPLPVKSSGAGGLVIGAVVVGALLVLFGVGGAAFFMMRSQAAPPVPPVATAPPVISAVPSVAADAPPEIAPDPVMIPRVAPASPPRVVDAGRPPAKEATKDAGPPAPSQDDKDRALAKTMQPSCDHFHMMMSLANTPDERKRRAEDARGHNCLMQPAIRCQRQVCREACFALDDDACKRNVDDWDRMFPAKY